MSRGLLTLAVLLPGCAYISDADEKWRLDPDDDGVLLGEDCDDQDGEAAALVTFWADADGDGFGDPDTEQTACKRSDGAADNADDCDDTDPDVFPAAPDAWYDGVDSDCAGDDDYDQDGDGYTVDVDCDDTDPALAPDPGIAETWFNGVDDNCDLADQDGDQDGDGYWADDYVSRVEASGASPLPIPDGRAGDCWDHDSTTPAEQDVVPGATALTAEQVHPGATETWYDGADQDCLGDDADGNGVDDDFDQDGDAYASALHPDEDGATGADCDDQDAAVNPDATEVWYDGVDADCNGSDDYDADGDLSRSDAHGGDDCDDQDPAVNPSALDFWYDGVDQDCGGEDDYDADGDGDPSADWGGFDCDDADDAIHTGAVEVWYDGVDQDCDGGSDYDADADGYDASDALASGLDCDDADSGVSPDATEVCADGVDNDCDGTTNGCGLEGDLLDTDADATFTGSTRGGRLADGVAGGADVTGDGATDLLLGASYRDSGRSNPTVYVFDGSTMGAAAVSDAVATVEHDDSESEFGFALAAGDVTGDGAADLSVGAPGFATGAYPSAGAVYLFHGPITGALDRRDADTTVEAAIFIGSSVGHAVSVLGDQDGDGADELLIGAPGRYADAVYVLPSRTTGSSTTAALAEYRLADSGSATGTALATGDIDGDGTADAVVGSPEHSSGAGVATILYGPITAGGALEDGANLYGASSDAAAGQSVSIAEDFDGDGYADVVVGIPGETHTASSEVGLVTVHFGPVTADGAAQALADRTLYSDDLGGSSGYDAACGISVDASGDLDADGASDLVVGCYELSPGGVSRGGVAYVFHGGPGTGLVLTTDADAAISGTSPTERVGHRAAILPDLDGDGFDDLLLGAPRFDVTTGAGTDEGRALLFLGGGW